MCKYCEIMEDEHNYQPMVSEEHQTVNVDIGICKDFDHNSADLVCTLYTNNGESIKEVSIPILYCPICGRNLQKLQLL